MTAARAGVAYAALAATYLGLFGYNASWGGTLVKPLPILLLAVLAWQRAAPAWRAPLTAALLFSALGDVLLAAHGIVGGLFTWGLGSFLVAQLCYAGVFWRHRRALPLRRALAVGYLPVAAGLAWFILPAAGELAVPVGLYLLAITAMVTGAALADRPLLLFAGALAFAFSDATIAVNKFLSPVPEAGLVIMLSYYLAQWLICQGALQLPSGDER